MAEDFSERLKNLNQKIKEFETKKIKAESELAMFKTQYDSLKEELRLQGVENVDDLPGLIEQLEKDLETELTKAESEVGETEKKIASLQ